MVFFKNTEKRSRSSSSSANNSFVQNVTSRMTGLLPATITRWFSSPSSSNANGSTPIADSTDSSTEDEGPDSPITTQPPSKRMRFSSPGQYNHSMANQEFQTCIISPNMEPSESNSTYNPVPSTSSSRQRRETILCSPRRSLPDQTHVPTDKSERDSPMFKSHTTMASTGPSVSTRRKSLFSTDETSMINASKKACEKTANNTVKDPRKPCFKPSLLGSPFYPGQTIYGGAASTYINQPNIKQRSCTRVNESSASDNSAMSQSARRILDLLENYSSPLIEAKRFAYCVPNDTLNSSFNRSNANTSKALTYKTQSLHLPSMATMLRLKQRSRLMDTTSAARQLIASQSSSTSDFTPYPTIQPTREESAHAKGADKNTKLRTKVKSRLTRTNRGNSDEIDSSVVEPVTLPDAVLQIDKDKLPTFSFEGPVNNKNVPLDQPWKTSVITSTPLSLSQSTSSYKLKRTVIENSQKEVEDTNKLFKFSSPVRISSDSPDATTFPKFTFGSPERSVENTGKAEKTVATNSNETASFVKNDVKEKDWQCPSCWVSNKADCDKCVCCGELLPSKNNVNKPANCSDSNTGCTQPSLDITSNTSKTLKIQNTGKWTCNDCWVSNDESSEKCVACGAKNPAIARPSVKNTNEKDWTCSECWIPNKSDIEKCVACGNSKPGAQPSTKPDSALPSTFKTSDNSLTLIAQTQSEKWECSNCLVRNSKELGKCACCELDKPGGAKGPATTTTATTATQSFNFGIKPDTSFKFGISPTLQTATKDTKSLFGNTLKPEESETNNNVLPKPQSFSFGVSTKLSETQTKDKPKNEESPNLAFTFNVPKPTPETKTTDTKLSTGFKLPEYTKTLPEDEEKPQEVPKVDLTVPTEASTPKLPIFGMNSTFTSKPNQDNPLLQINKNPLLRSTFGDIKRKLKDLPEETSAAKSEVKPAVSFRLPSEAKMTAAPVVFGVTTANTNTATEPTGIFASSLKSTPLTTTASMHQKAETAPTTASSLFGTNSTTTSAVFQNTDAQTTVAAPTVANGAMFSFALNASAAQSQPDKQKFSFSFGNKGTTEAAAAVVPSFGGTTTADKSATNNFSFSTTSNANTLETANALPVGNALGAGTLTASSVLGNGHPAALGGGNGLPNNSIAGFGMPAANNLPIAPVTAPPTTIFGTVQKENNAWPTTNHQNTNLFAASSNGTTAKPAAFSFGSSTPFNNSGANTFGNSTPQTNNVFGMGNPSVSQPQPNLFSNPANAPSGMFGAAGPTPTPAVAIFGQPTPAAAPAFGTPNSFEQPAINAAPAAAFNFGASQAGGVFGFGQQPGQPQQLQQQAGPGGVYNFGGPATPQMQFSLGIAPSTTVRKMRKAVRRNPTR